MANLEKKSPVGGFPFPAGAPAKKNPALFGAGFFFTDA